MLTEIMFYNANAEYSDERELEQYAFRAADFAADTKHYNAALYCNLQHGE